MFQIRTLVLAAAVVTGIFSLSNANAQVGYYGLLSNQTGMTVNYQYRINNGAWTNASLPPGVTVVFGAPMSYFQTYKNAQFVVQLRYDTLVGPGEVWRVDTLGMYRANSPSRGYWNRFLRANPYNQRIWVYLSG
jgi:hypothetical protein